MKYILLSLSMLLTACATTQSPQAPAPKAEVRVIDTACTWVKELTFSKNDTEETKRQIIEHDKALRKNCPKKQ